MTTRLNSILISLIITTVLIAACGCGPSDPSAPSATPPSTPGMVTYRDMLHPNNQVTTGVPGLSGVIAVASGTRHDIMFGLDYGLALKSDGTVWSWIINAAGQLQAGEPDRIEGLSSITAISSGMGNSLALDSDGYVWYWYTFGDLSSGITTTTGSAAAPTPASRNPIPVQVKLPDTVIAISAGLRYSLVLLSDGTVWGWGENTWGQLGNGTTTNSDTPVQVQNLDSVIAITAGHYHSMALKSNGTAWAWGDNESGELGNGTTINSAIPVQVSELGNIVAIAAGEAHSMALKKDGTVWAWGNNESGQAGNGTQNTEDNPAVTIPVKVKNLWDIVAISEGGIPGGGAELNGGMVKYGAGYCLALRSDGTVWTWGAYGSNSEPWTNPFNSVDAQVGSFSGVQAITGGGNYAIAIMPQASDKIIGRWYYNLPQEYDTELIFIDPAAAAAEIDGRPYLILSFNPSSGPNNSRLFIFDAENPVAPRLLSNITRETKDSRDTFLVRDIAIRNNVIYSSLFGDLGLWMVDIADPANPVDLGIAPVKMGNNIVVDNNYAYGSGLDNIICVSNISDAANVFEASRIDIASRDCCLAVSGQLLFVGIEQTLTVIDISKPSSPELICEYDLDVPSGLDRNIPNPGPGKLQWERWATINDLQVSGDHVYVTFGAGRLRVVDVSNPADPHEASNIGLNGFCVSLTLLDNYLFATTADTDTGKLQVCPVDISQPEHPALIDYIPTQSDFVLGGVTFAYCWERPLVTGDYVYIAGRDYIDIIKIK